MTCRIAAFCAISALPILAQSQPAETDKPAFDVASVKLNTSADHRAMFMMQPGGRLKVTNVPAKMLITMAYDLKPNQLEGAPEWLASTAYDIEAKAGDGPADPDKVKLMLQTLLADRFKLAIHRETKELPVYVMVAGKNGASKLHPSANTEGDKKATFRISRGQITLEGATLARLADQLSREVGRNVIDKTGISGSFDIKLEWTPDMNEGGPKLPDGHKEDTASVGDTGPSFFTAIQEQLGLKLESQKAPVEVVVIDHIEKASEN